MSHTSTYYDVAREGFAAVHREVDVTRDQLHELEATLGGPLEVLQLDETHCLLTNALARQQSWPKNKPASQLWFEKHPVSGHGADFILGPVIYCLSTDIAHLNHLHAEPKPVLTKEQRAEQPALLLAADRNAEQRSQQLEEAKLLCSLDNPTDCQMCGS